MDLGYVVLYMNDTEAAKNFWVEKVGFELKKEVNAGELNVYTVGAKDAITNIELVPLALMENNPMDINTGTPSMAFYTADLKAEHARLTENGVNATEIMEHQGMTVFTFFDEENQAFAMLQK